MSAFTVGVTSPAAVSRGGRSGQALPSQRLHLHRHRRGGGGIITSSSSSSSRKCPPQRLFSATIAASTTATTISSPSSSLAAAVLRRHPHHRRRLATTITNANPSPSSSASTKQQETARSAETVVRGMYDAINRRDVPAALEFVDDDILYEDFNFPTPFKGKAAVKKLFEESCEGIPDDMLFIVDECTDGGGIGVGMTWYVELEGEPFPNARGASFYRINPESGKLVYARDVVEPPFKLGDVSFSIIRAVAPLVKQQLRAKKQERLATTTTTTGAGAGATGLTEGAAGAAARGGETESGGGADPAPAPAPAPAAAAALYALGAAYWFVLLLSPPGWQGLPGEPAWAVAPDTLSEVIAESTDFFFVLPLLNACGVDLLGAAPQVHPVTLGVFNFAEAFVFMLLPPLLMDRKGRDLPTVKLWSFAMFLTNALLLPYMAKRTATPVPASWEEEKAAAAAGDDSDGVGLAEITMGEKGLLSKAFGVFGFAVGLLSVWWASAADPAVGGDLAQRSAFLGELMTSDRVSLAFAVDIVIFSCWQAYLIGEVDPEAPAACRFVPFWGLAAWLML